MQSSTEFSPPIRSKTLEAIVSVNPESLSSDTPLNFQFLYIDISSVNQGVINWNAVTSQTFSTAPSRARRVVRPRDILLCAVRPALQAHTFADWQDTENYICSTGFVVLRISSAIEPRYLYHLLFHSIIADQLRRLEIGSNYPAVNETDIRNLLVPVPLLDEQRSIARILDTLDTQIRETERLIAKLKQVRDGLLYDLLTKGIDEHGEVRDPMAHSEEFKETAFGLIPKDWEIGNVGGLGTWRGGSTPATSLEDNWVGGDILWISPKDIQGTEITDSQDKITEKALSRYNLTVFSINTIIVVFRSGVLRHTFPIATVNKPFTVNQDIKVLLPRRKINYKFAFFALQAISPKVLRFAVKAGTTVESIDLKTFLDFPILLPEKEEQNTIVAILDAHDARITAEESRLHKLKQIKKGLMHDLLTGTVRVTSLVASDGQ